MQTGSTPGLAALTWLSRLPGRRRRLPEPADVPSRVGATFDAQLSTGSRQGSSFSLDFPGGTAPNLTDDFGLSCQLLVNIDPCEAQVAAVEDIQRAIANIEGRAKELNSGQVHEPPAQIQAELDQLGKEMLEERSKLAAAELALKRCREGIVTPVAPGGPVKNDLRR